MPLKIQPLIAQKAQSFPVEDIKDDDIEELNTLFTATTISDDESVLFPRCEFYTRFPYTSIFPSDVDRVHVYTRSEGARYYAGTAKSDGPKFIPIPLTQIDKVSNSLSAHTGGFANPYILPAYSSVVKETKHDFSKSLNPELYNELLKYKLHLCNHIATEFRRQIPRADLGGSTYSAKIISTNPNNQDFKNVDIVVYKYKYKKINNINLYVLGEDKKIVQVSLDNRDLIKKLCETRVGSNRQLENLLKEFQPYLVSKGLYPLKDEQGVYCSNNYPCVLVKFTPNTMDKSITDAEAITIYKRYNHMLMAYFTAIVDYNAYTVGIEIEMVGRSSFGHNNPSISVTDTSFRINIGLVPKEYADIIVSSLVQLYNLFYVIEYLPPEHHLVMDKTLQDRLNAGRTVGFSELKLPDTYWAALWVKGSHGATGRNMIHELIERERDRPELLTNFVLNCICKSPTTFFTDSKLAEEPLEMMFQLVNYNADRNRKLAHHISVNSKEVLRSHSKRRVKKPSVKGINRDPELLLIMQKFCDGLGLKLPKDLSYSNLYTFLEKSHIEFITTKRTRTYGDQVPEYGSDSDTEEVEFVPSKSVFAKKVIVANGMLALDLAYYAAKVGIYAVHAIDENVQLSKAKYEQNNSLQISVNCENTYFETGDCLKAASNPPIILKGVQQVDILFFDLNSFNSAFIAQVISLDTKLTETSPTIIVLDHTSTTTDKIEEAIKTVFKKHKTVRLLLLVTSGLKNEQGGADNNPYGKMTIISLGNDKTNSFTNFVYNEVIALKEKGLSKKALLPKAAHMIRHSYKDRGFATTTKQILGVKQALVTDQIDELSDQLNEMDLNKKIATLHHPKTQDLSPEQSYYKTFNEILRPRLPPNTEAKFISGEGNACLLRAVFRAKFKDAKYENIPSVELRKEVVNKIVEFHNTANQEKIKKIRKLLIIDFIKTLPFIAKRKRNEFLMDFKTKFSNILTNEQIIAIETLILKGVIKEDDLDLIKLLSMNIDSIITHSEVVNFIQSYLRRILKIEIFEGPEMLGLLAIILDVKIKMYNPDCTSSQMVESTGADQAITEKICLIHINYVTGNPTEEPNHYNVLLVP